MQTARLMKAGEYIKTYFSFSPQMQYILQMPFSEFLVASLEYTSSCNLQYTENLCSLILLAIQYYLCKYHTHFFLTTEQRRILFVNIIFSNLWHLAWKVRSNANAKGMQRPRRKGVIDTCLKRSFELFYRILSEY